jgi:Protein of unknown function (DUF3102)
MALPTEGSNSLADLAHRINAEHEATLAAVKTGLEHAIAAGQLLLEAQAQIPHGQWLPWIRANCATGVRTAQRYMELARHTPDPKCDSLTYLAPEADQEPDWDDVDGVIERTLQSLDRPFGQGDVAVPGQGDERGELRFDWVMRKLMHQVGLPWTVKWCFDVSDVTEDGRPALRLCPWDHLLEAAKKLAPIVNGERALKFDGFRNMHDMRLAIRIVELDAMWMLGNVLNEMQDRERLSDEDYEHEREERYNHVMAGLDEKRGRGAQPVA